MVHWHSLCWRRDGEPNNLLHEALQAGLAESDFVNKLAEWAFNELSLTAMYPAGSYADGKPRNDKWSPPEGTAPAPSEEKNIISQITHGCVLGSRIIVGRPFALNELH